MHIIIETFRQYGEPSSSKVRARPLAGQGLPTDLRVECSKKMRLDHPVGSLFKVWASVTDREGTTFVYTNHRDGYERVTPAAAAAFIRKTFRAIAR